jgi:hypothetical protein
MNNPLWFPKKPTYPAGLGRARIKRLQITLNKFAKEHLTGITPLIVDGKMGALTRRRIIRSKYYMGMVGKHGTKVNRHYMRRLRNPNKVGNGYADSKATVERGKERRQEQHRLYTEQVKEYSGKPHWATYDGKMIAAYLVPINDWARKTGYNGVKWHGNVVSGGRTAAYSEHLCESMCGRPSCPGRCAGTSSNHVGNNPKATPCGAEDVSDYRTFNYLMGHCPFDKLNAPRIFNNLPIDPVHFSPRGN